MFWQMVQSFYDCFSEGQKEKHIKCCVCFFVDGNNGNINDFKMAVLL